MLGELGLLVIAIYATRTVDHFALMFHLLACVDSSGNAKQLKRNLCKQIEDLPAISFGSSNNLNSSIEDEPDGAHNAACL